MQSAYTFIKPHANTEKMQAVVKKKFEEVGIKIVSEGEITGETIDEKKFIDQHYYAIASKATILQPTELNIPTDKFKETFGEEWADVLKEGRALNAIDCCKAHFSGDAAALDAAWAACKKAGKLVKFGGGFYCGLIGEYDGKKTYTFNAFFMTMRSAFTKPGTSIHYYAVEFDPATLKWADFRGKVLGPTDPADAPADSLRGMLMAQWESLDLKSAPNTGDNGVHASASPFEGFAERTNWLASDYSIASDPFGKLLVAEGITEDTLKAWSVDPQVTIPGGDGKKGSLFDQVEDLDLADCLKKCVEINAAQ